MEGSWEIYQFTASTEHTELVERLREQGLMYLINRAILHPLGMALAVGLDDRGDVSGFGLYLSDDPPVVYSDDLNEKGVKMLRDHHPMLLMQCMKAGLL